MAEFCAWCGEPAIGMIVVDPALHRIVKGIDTIVHPERLAHACARHASPHEVDRQGERRTKKADARRWRAEQVTIEDLL